MPEEQDVHADHDGYQREHVKHEACLPSHRSTLLLDDRVAATDDAAGRTACRALPTQRHRTERFSSTRCNLDQPKPIGPNHNVGKIRCPHKPESMTLSHEHPTILSPPKNAPVCCAQKTITVPPSVGAKTTQKYDYPSQAHRHSYARRSAAERSFSHLHDPASNDIKRGWCRLIRLTPNTLFLACAFIIANTRVADAFAARQAENEQRAACGLPPKRRRKRRRTLHNPTSQANAPPAIAA